MSKLFEPISLGKLTLANRIVIAPMCQYSSDEGKATSWHHAHLGQLSFSGAGLLILEATAVEAVGRISAQDLGLWDDATEAAMKDLVTGLRENSDMPLGLQLGHAGRKASEHKSPSQRVAGRRLRLPPSPSPKALRPRRQCRWSESLS
ncbi:NADH:flavin oxidoreductase [Rahnella aquatilis HX2]|nr:NADH:flavin oxidoreductase [Rahnella aquatilis HX2]